MDRRARERAGPCGRGRRAGFSDPPAHARGPVRGRRRHRRDRPHPGPAHGRAARPERRRREHRRRRRDGGRRAGREGGARRLHVRDRQCGHPRLQPDALQEAALQCGDRLHADRARNRVATHPDHPQGSAGQQSARADRLHQGQPEQDAVRLGRSRLRHAPALRTVQSRDRRQGHACFRIGARPRPCRT